MEGVEAVIDKDRAAARLASDLKADALLLLTDVPGVFLNFGQANQSEIGSTALDALNALEFAPGSMGPKVAAVSTFVRSTAGFAGIGSLADARSILEGRAGTRVLRHPTV